MNLNNCIIFDTETNGIRCFRPPTHRLLQLAYITPDKKYTTYIKGVTKMAPDLPHNITIEKCNEEGIDSKDAILKFMEEIRKVDVIIAHNIEFDIGIVRHILEEDGHTELLVEFNKLISEKYKLCTMQSTKNFCKLEFKNPRRRVYNSVKEYKWPSLEELYTKLYLKPTTEELHDALQDCIVLEKCIIKLKNRGDFVIA